MEQQLKAAHKTAQEKDRLVQEAEQLVLEGVSMLMGLPWSHFSNNFAIFCSHPAAPIPQRTGPESHHVVSVLSTFVLLLGHDVLFRAKLAFSMWSISAPGMYF